MQVHTEIFAEKESHFLSNRLLEFTNEMQTQPRLPDLRAVEMKPMSRK